MLNEVAGWFSDKFTDGPAPANTTIEKVAVVAPVAPDLSALIQPGPLARMW